MNGKVGLVKPFILYGTAACHLCETAESLLEAATDGGDKLVYQKCDIAESDELFERYALHIPVLQHPQGGELYWPFGVDELRDFCGS